MNITMLGTGNAMVTECYNTCFVLEDGDKHLLVDGGGGNTLLRQLKQAGFDWKDMREIFVTHKHVDHIMGVVWMIRMICHNMKERQLSMDTRKSSEFSKKWQRCFTRQNRPALLETVCIWLW